MNGLWPFYTLFIDSSSSTSSVAHPLHHRDWFHPLHFSLLLMSLCANLNLCQLSNQPQNELHALHHPDRTPLIYSLSSCVVAARAFKLRVIDGVHLNLNDPEGFAAACAQGRYAPPSLSPSPPYSARRACQRSARI